MEGVQLSDFYYNRTFMSNVRSKMEMGLSGAYSMVAIDIEHFRLFNKLYGREAGDELILYIQNCLKEIAGEYDGVEGYLGADNFGIFIPDSHEIIKQIQEQIIKGIHKWNNTVGFYPVIGIYSINTDTDLPEIMYDRATLALSNAFEGQPDHICHYTQEMESRLEKEVELLSEIQEALKNNEFTFFAQPQCNIATHQIVGAEALVRWVKPDGTMVSPGAFIPVLEKNGMIDRLDRYVWDKVCAWIRSWIDRGFQPVPISINVSRVDIFSMDVPAYIFSLLEKYQLSEHYVKVEITESAYTESDERITNTVNILRGKGFKVMMDDFGCGYSSLNMLKNIPVDVLKLDMRFLDISETEEEKGMNILESVVNMARLLRLPIIVEGVETEKQEQFVQSLGCRYIQGFYFYKPLPVKQFEELLSDERQLDFHDLFYKQVEPLHIREFMDTNFITDSMLNNVLGPVAFYEMRDHQIEITRVNEQYFQLMGTSSGKANSYGKRFWNHVHADDRVLLHTIFEKAFSNQMSGADGYIHFMQMDGTVILVYMRVFFLREKDGCRQYYGSLMNVTEVQADKKQAEVQTQITDRAFNEDYESLEAHFGKMPTGFCIDRLILDENNKPVDYEILYANETMRQVCTGDLEQLKALSYQSFGDKVEEAYTYMYNAAYKGEKKTFYLYSHISNRYMQFTYYQYREGYIGVIIQDITNTYIASNALKSMMLSYREVYFVQLKDNYYHMIYPDENSLQERGNYEESINRHFYMGKIVSTDEKNIRKFLSLTNLNKGLAKQDTLEMSYKRLDEKNNKEWCLTTVAVCERDSDGTPKDAVIVIRSIDTLMQGRKDKRAVYLSETLANMSEGFFIYRAVGEEKLLYANPGAIRLFGCETIEEFREQVHNSFRGMVHPQDLARVEWEIHDQIKQSDRSMDYIKYRIVRKDGTVRWLDDCGHLEHQTIEAGGGLFYVFISDITDTITEAQKNMLLAKNKYYNSEKQ